VVETSTLSTPSEAAAIDAAVASPNQPDLSQLPEDLLREFDPQSFLDVPERLGFLKELGLDFGWGPTACCEWLLEHIHIYTGMPWWGSIAAVAILFRGIMFFPTLTGSKHQARLQKIHTSPAYVKAKAEFDEAAWRTKDQAAMMYARSEMRRLMKESGVSMWRPFVSFAMFPFSYGMFRLIRGMAGIPVPSMENGGLAWFSDLTVYDPFFVLPCISVGLAVLMFKVCIV
jgi:YidC/Oxa1 family membrane protein insertase